MGRSRLNDAERRILASLDVPGVDPQSRLVFEASVRKGWNGLMQELPKLTPMERKVAFAAFLRGLEQGFDATTKLMPTPRLVERTSITDYLNLSQPKKK